MTRPILISLSPNAQKDDVRLAFRVLVSPWKWKSVKEIVRLEDQFQKLFGSNYKCLSINSGRSALYMILRALGVGQGDEVVLQAFTCVAVSNSISWTGAKPIYCDIDQTLNIDSMSLAKKLTKKTKAVIIQNTFGISADFDSIKKVVHKFNSQIVIIEDCAHAMGATYKGKKVGTLGDVSFFSFGRDKVVSSVFGGMVMTRDQKLFDKLKSVRDSYSDTPMSWIFQQLLHPIAFSVILPLYNYQFGKVILYLLLKTKLLSKAVYKQERSCGQPKCFPAKMPGGLAVLASNQIAKLYKFNEHRRKVAKLYSHSFPQIGSGFDKESIYLRYSIFTDDARGLFKYLKKKGILVGDWYKEVIAPIADTSCARYELGDCKKAEIAAKRIVNLPTYPNLKTTDAKYLIEEVKKWQNLKH